MTLGGGPYLLWEHLWTAKHETLHGAAVNVSQMKGLLGPISYFIFSIW